MTERPELDGMSMPTEELDGAEIARCAHRQQGGRPGVRARLLVSACGVLAGGLVALGAGMIVAQVLSARHGMPGPGTWTILGLVAGAIVAVLCATVADRAPGTPRWLGCLGVLVTTGAVLWFYWWA